MELIKAIIVDDEQPARDLVSNLINRYFESKITIVSKCTSITEAQESIEMHQPKLVFLDVSMPGGNGFELLKHKRNLDFEVVFITAHKDFATKAFEYSALGYLLKPIDLHAFQNTVSKTISRIEQDRFFISAQVEDLIKNLNGQTPQKIWIQSEKESIGVLVGEILFCKASGAYSEIYLVDNSVLISSKSLKQMKEILFRTNFIKCHKSYLVNKIHIKKILKGENWMLKLELGHQIPISHRKRKEVNEQVVA